MKINTNDLRKSIRKILNEKHDSVFFDGDNATAMSTIWLLLNSDLEYVGVTDKEPQPGAETMSIKLITTDFPNKKATFIPGDIDNITPDSSTFEANEWGGGYTIDEYELPEGLTEDEAEAIVPEIVNKHADEIRNAFETSVEEDINKEGNGWTMDYNVNDNIAGANTDNNKQEIMNNNIVKIDEAKLGKIVAEVAKRMMKEGSFDPRNGEFLPDQHNKETKERAIEELTKIMKMLDGAIQSVFYQGQLMVGDEDTKNIIYNAKESLLNCSRDMLTAIRDLRHGTAPMNEDYINFGGMSGEAREILNWAKENVEAFVDEKASAEFVDKGEILEKAKEIVGIYAKVQGSRGYEISEPTVQEIAKIISKRINDQKNDFNDLAEACARRIRAGHRKVRK